MKINDICSFNVKNINKDFAGSYIKYLDTSNLTKNIIDSIVTYHIQKAPSRAKRIVAENDILISTVRPNQCHYGFVDSSRTNLIVSTGFLVITPNINTVNAKYLYYFLTQQNITNYLHMVASTATSSYPSITPDIVANLDILLPSLDQQNKIADILTTIDSKIELNNQINKDLEELAQTLYTKWFVNFDFPNEKGKPYKSSGGKMVESELGLIPEGWSVENLAENSISTLIKTGVDEFEDTKIYLATAAVTNDSIIDSTKCVTYANRESRANMQPQPNSVWFAKMKSSKKILYFGDYSDKYLSEYLLSTGFCGIQCVENSLEYIWNFINRDEFEIKKDSLAHGATQQSVNNSDLKNIKLIIPTNTILSDFKKLTRKLYQLKYSNNIENISLIELRDTLLPYLMNGTIKVD